MTESIASSDLSTARNDLTVPSEFDAQLPPPTKPTLSTTSNEDDVGLDLARLPCFIRVIPLKRARSSWVWQHGFQIMKQADGLAYWVCKICHRSKVSNTTRSHIYLGSSTKHGAEHVRKYHPKVLGLETLPSVAQQLRTSSSTLITPFNAQQFKDSLVEWLICDDITYRQACSPRLRHLLSLANPLVEPALPRSHNTAISWMKQLYRVKREDVKGLLQNTKARVNLSSDLWTSDTHLPLLGIVAHFISKASI